MIAYADSSVLLRKVQREPEPLVEWPDIRTLVVSELAGVECSRSFDRFRLLGGLDPEEFAMRRETIQTILATADVLPIDRQTLKRAAQAFPAPIGTLDAIHLASALLYQEATDTEIVFATHDTQLAIAARAAGLSVIGIPRKKSRR